MFILASCNDYFSKKLYSKLNTNKQWIYVKSKQELQDTVNKYKPNKIFFLHWSFIVPKSIYNNYTCINIHTSNLPYGKGGSPLQNQIIDGIMETKVNALKMSDDGLDAGPVYCSKEVTLQGNLFDIWLMITEISYNLINKIIDENIQPISQEKINDKIYKRRKNNKIPFEETDNLEKIYDFIRMLDSPYYPDSYIEVGNFRLNFNRSSFNGEKILSDVQIEKI